MISGNGKIVKEYLSKYPYSQSNYLSKLIYKENVKYFKDSETVRRIIRYYRKSSGDIDRKYLCEDEYNPIISIPENNCADYSPYIVTETKFPISVNADVHFPYHDQDALEIYLEQVDKIKPKIIIINGDLLDFYQLSTWQKDPRKRSIDYELELAINYFNMLHTICPNSKIIYKYGNHEERYNNYIMQHAPELFKLEYIQLGNLIKSKLKFDIDIVENKRIIKIKHLNIIHGHEYKFSISNPVNPARGLFLRTKKISLCNHFHQTSEHNESTISNEIISTWSGGCLCDLHPEYMPLNKWNHGFIEIYDDEEFFNVQNKKIINFKIV